MKKIKGFIGDEFEWPVWYIPQGSGMAMPISPLPEKQPSIWYDEYHKPRYLYGDMMKMPPVPGRFSRRNRFY